MSGAGDPRRNKEGLESAWRYLVDQKNGIIRLGTPFYSEPPQAGENHPVRSPATPRRREHGPTRTRPYGSPSASRCRDGDRAFELLGMLNPMVRTLTPERLAQYRQEPYAVAADRNADEPVLGRAGWTQYTGSAGWLYRAYVEYILGLRFQDGGLLIDPALPSAWDGYTAQKTPGPCPTARAWPCARRATTSRSESKPVSKGWRPSGGRKACRPARRAQSWLTALHRVEVLMVLPRRSTPPSAARGAVEDNRPAFVRGTLPRPRGQRRSRTRRPPSAPDRLGLRHGYAACARPCASYWLELYPPGSAYGPPSRQGMR